jgi:hypothetical protein
LVAAAFFFVVDVDEAKASGTVPALDARLVRATDVGAGPGQSVLEFWSEAKFIISCMYNIYVFCFPIFSS